MNIGEKIKALRKYRKLTQEQLSEGLITRNMLSLIESGKALPSLTVLATLSGRLKITADFLLNDDNDDIKSALLVAKMSDFEKLYQKKQYSKLIKDSEEFISCKNETLDFLRAKAYFRILSETLKSGDIELSKECIKNVDQFIDSQGLDNLSGLISLYKIMINGYSDGKLPYVVDYIRENGSTAEMTAYFYILNLCDKGMPDKAAVLYDVLSPGYEPLKLHINSKLAAANLNFTRARELLLELTRKYKSELPVSLFIIICGELENYCTKLSDYKGAYDARVMIDSFADKGAKNAK